MGTVILFSLVSWTGYVDSIGTGVFPMSIYAAVDGRP